MPVRKRVLTALDLERTSDRISPTSRRLSQRRSPAAQRGGMAATGGRQELSDATSSGSSTSADERDAGRGRREITQTKRSRFRLRKHLGEWRESAGAGRTFLAAQAVTKKTRRGYARALAQWESFVRKRGLPRRSAAEIDDALAGYFDECYFLGQQPSVGERVLAGIMDDMPRFGRFGDLKIPLSWRSLRGWRRLTPPRSRKPLPWPVWAAIAWRLAAARRRDMMLFVLLCVSGYFRPGELLRLRRGDLVPPARGILDGWSALIAPEEENRPTKVGNFNDSVNLSCSLMPWLGVLLADLHLAGSTAPAWKFTYNQFMLAFQTATTELQLARIVPYQMRHSGPSIDLALGHRSLEEAQKRGRWASASTMARYERHSRLAKEWDQLNVTQQQLFQQCADQLEAVATGRRHTCALQLLTRG